MKRKIGIALLTGLVAAGCRPMALPVFTEPVATETTTTTTAVSSPGRPLADPTRTTSTTFATAPQIEIDLTELDDLLTDLDDVLDDLEGTMTEGEGQ